MLRRRLFNLLGVALLLLNAALAAAWVRSERAQDSIYRVSVDARGALSVPMVLSDNGRLAFIYRWNNGPAKGTVRVGGWKHMARPRFYEFEAVRWASLDIQQAAPHRVEVVVRYRLLLTLTLLLSLCWFQISRRWKPKRAAGLCNACGYNLTGNTSGVCPECGVSIERKTDIPSVPWGSG